MNRFFEVIRITCNSANINNEINSLSKKLNSYFCSHSVKKLACSENSTTIKLELNFSETIQDCIINTIRDFNKKTQGKSQILKLIKQF